MYPREMKTCSQKDLCMDVCSSLIHNSQRLETIPNLHQLENNKMKYIHSVEYYLEIKKNQTTVSCEICESYSVVSDSLQPYGLYSPWHSLGQNTGVGSLSLLQVIFLTQGSNPGLLYCGWILYQLSHTGSPRILEWVAYPFSRGSSHPRNQTRVSCTAGKFFTN